MRHLRAFILAALVVVGTNTASVLAAPQTQVLHKSSKPVAAAECALAHQLMANSPAATLAERAWGRSRSTSDCVLVSETTTQVDSNGVAAWDGCYNRESTETFTSHQWPYPTLARGHMRYGLCWTQTQITISWASCYADTFPIAGSGVNYCAGAPTSAGSWCAVEMDWYFFAYSSPWYHFNHGLYDEWAAPLYAVGFYQW